MIGCLVEKTHQLGARRCHNRVHTRITAAGEVLSAPGGEKVLCTLRLLVLLLLTFREARKDQEIEPATAADFEMVRSRDGARGLEDGTRMLLERRCSASSIPKATMPSPSPR